MTARPVLSERRRNPIRAAVVLCIVLVGVIIFSSASADNVIVTQVTAQFITIDSVGDHTIGEVFFINGTTNLPVTENLTMDIVTGYHPAMKNSPYHPYLNINVNDIPIISATSGDPRINYWSVNVTDIVKQLVNDKYDVSVLSSKIRSVGIGYVSFHLIPATNVTTSLQNQTTLLPSPPPIQPIFPSVTVLPTKQPSSLPLALPIIVIVAIVIMRYIRANKRLK